MSQEIVRHGGAQMSPALVQLGVQIQTDAQSGFRAVTFPDDLRSKVNVLLPVQEIAATDPNFSPSIRMVQLDTRGMDAPGGQVGSPHVYKQGNNRYAPTKQGLEVIATCAGILATVTGRVPKAELADDEIGYWAEVKIRRSDGSIDRIRREKIVSWQVEQFKIDEQVDALAQKYSSDWNEVRIATEKKKRKIAERENLHAKCESKAALRAIRAALQIPHVFTKEQIEKPFLVVGYSLTPDWNDPETKRLLLQHGLGAAADVYGGSTQPSDVALGEVGAVPEREAQREGHVLPPAPGEPGPRDPDPEELPPVDDTGRGEPPQGDRGTAVPEAQGSAATTPPEPSQPDQSDAAPAGGEGHGELRSASPPPAGASEPEPPPAGETPDALRAGAGMVKIGFGRHSGKTIAEIHEEDENYVGWLAEKANSPDVRRAASQYLGL